MRRLTESDYWSEGLKLGVEIENAATIFDAYEEIQQSSRENRAVFEALNREAVFWRTFVYSLQTSLFVILGRIFDEDPNAYSIHKFLKQTLGHIEFFSFEALAARKRSLGLKPEDVERFVAAAWVPKDASDLRHLRKVLSPHIKRFKEVYKPIRNRIYAHRLSSTPEEISQLFAPTNRGEIASMIQCLRAVINAVEGLYLNGREPVVNLSGGDAYGQIRKSVSKVLGVVAGMSNAARED